MRRLPAGPLLMWSLSASGMALGLVIDCRSMMPAAFASLCTAESGALLGSFTRHLALLPATNAGMLLGGLLALALRQRIDLPAAATTIACYVFMLAGMSLAGCLGPVLAARLGVDWDAVVMFAAMTAGMTFGMVAVTALGRLTASTTQEFRYRRWPAAETR